MKIDIIKDRFELGMRSLRSDERGAESSEVIIVLVLLVIGLMAAFALLRNRLSSSASKTADCIGGANTSQTCGN